MGGRIRGGIFTAGVGAIAAAGVMIAIARPAAQSQDELDKRFLQAWSQQTRISIPVPPGPTAKVTVIKFNDWMCPGCKFWYEAMKPILAKYQATPGAVRYVEKDWPWNSSCNSGVTQTINGHQASCAAAAAVRLAADRGKREAMAEWIYANQPPSVAQAPAVLDLVRTKASEMLGIKDFIAAYGTKLSDIQKDVMDGKAAMIRSTPTYFINGVRAVQQDESTIPVHYMELAIQYELQKK